MQGELRLLLLIQISYYDALVHLELTHLVGL